MRRITLGDTVDFKFTTIAATGAPSTLSSSPVISAYPGNSLTELTAGITLTVDFDSRTGLNNCRVVASNGNGYAVDTEYYLVVTTGTVDGISAVGYVVGEFATRPGTANIVQILQTAVSTPATAGILDVNVKNWNNGAVSSAATGIPKVDVDTIKTNPVVNGGTITFPTTATLASTTNITAGTVTTATNVTTVNGLAANVITAASIAADADAEIATAVWTDTTASDFTTALSIGKSIMNGVSLGTGLKIAEVVLADTLTTYTGNTPQTGDSFARIGAAGVGLTNLGDTRIAHLDADISSRTKPADTQAAVTNVVGIGTGAIASTSFAAGAIDSSAIAANAIGASELATDAVTEIANGVLDQTDAIESGITLRSAQKLELSALSGKLSGAAGTTVTIRNVGDTKSRIIATVDASGNRTAITTDVS